jgi:hypothetical protein
VKVLAVPTVNVVPLGLVIAGPWLTLSVKLCEVLPELLLALMMIGYVPPVLAAGVPLSVAVPLPLSKKVRPFGNAPVSVRAGVGNPVVVSVKVLAVPTPKAALLALVIAGASPTVSVKTWVAAVPTPLLALNVMV